VILTDATYSDIDPFDPVFARPTVEWETVAGEHQECLEGFSPSENVYLNSLDTPSGLSQTVVAVLGQFRCTSGEAAVATGVERLFSSMTLELLRCDASDLTPPTINSVQIRVTDVETNTVEVRVDVSDDDGVKRIVVVKPTATGVESTELLLPLPLPTSGVFNILVPGVANGDNVVVQAEDALCNVALDTGKAAGRNFLTVDAGPDQPVSPPFNSTFTAEVTGFTQLTGPVWFVSEFSDGSFVDGVLAPESLRTVPVTVDGEGNARFTVQHSFGLPPPTDLAATLEVHASDGGVGVDDVGFFCNPDSPDGDCDLVFDVGEPTCNSDPQDGDLRPERIDSIFAGVSDDGDAAIDEALPEGSDEFDCDGDGYTGAAENHVYSYLPQTNGDQKTCRDYDTEFPDPLQTTLPSKSWPSDLSTLDVPSSTNRLTIADLTTFLGPIRYFDTNTGTRPGDVRWDLSPGKGLFLTDINILDITTLLTGDSGRPPMLGRQTAFEGPDCPWPP
jgi:hypothetical protein